MSRANSPPPHRTASGQRRRVWSINGDFLALAPTGVARYAIEVTRALDQLVGEQHPLTIGLELNVLAPRAAPAGFLDFIPVHVISEFNSPRLPQFWVQAQLPPRVEGGLLSLCNLAPVIVRHQIVCIHDLQTWIVPESYGLMFRLAHRLILPLLGRRARMITTVSGFSRAHLVDFGVAPEPKIVVAYNGSDHARRWQPARSRLDIGERPFVLALGRREAHKNALLIGQIAGPLAERGIDVYVAGDVDQRAIGTFSADRPSAMRLLGRISDDDLAFALSRALCFLLPSRIEGFGLPAVEAMALGCPVIASSAPCLPEVCGDAAIYAAPDDPGAWVSAVERLRADAALRSAMVAKGTVRAETYSWRSTAETYLELMTRVDCNI